jgi:RND family efflux transporter MFP subunit
VDARLRILLCLLLALAACDSGESGGEGAAPGPPVGAQARGPDSGPSTTLELSAEQQKRIQLTFATVDERLFPRQVRTTGVIDVDLRHSVRLTARIAGRIREVVAFPGEQVSVDQLLATLESPEYVAAQSEALLVARRLPALLDQEDAPERSRRLIEAARARLASLGAAPRDVVRTLEYGEVSDVLRVRSPLAGDVVTSKVEPGAAVEVGQELFWIADTRHLWVSLDLFAEDLATASIGSPIQLRVAAYPERTFGGHLGRIGSLVDEQSRTVKAQGEVDNRDRLLKPGMFAEVVVVDDSHSVRSLAVPESSVQTLGDHSVVFVQDAPGIFSAREVEIQRVRDGFVAITGQLSAGAIVAAQGSFFLKSELEKGSFGGDAD